MSADVLGDSSWDTALQRAHAALTPNGDLVRLVRNSWTGTMSLKDCIQGLQLATVPAMAVIEAAQILESSVSTIEDAITTLSFKGAATVAAVHFTVLSIARQCTSSRLQNYIAQQLIDQVEVGYHFGVIAEDIGPETGILLGFGQSIGSALLLATSNASLAEAKTIFEGTNTPAAYLKQFSCEPYQVASLALQRLGFGPSMASAAVMSLGNFSREVPSGDPRVKGWWAASEWINALGRGQRIPGRRSSALRYPELVFDSQTQATVPLHLEALYASVDKVLSKHSSWTWHLVESPSSSAQQPQNNL